MFGSPDPRQGTATPDDTATTSSAPQTKILALNGMVPIVTGRQLLDEEKARVQQAQNQPVIQGLVSHVRKCFDIANIAKRQTIEQRLLQCVRQRNGEYDPDKLVEIQKTRGSEIYMMLTSNKCRGAASWIKDVMFNSRNEMPWDVEPTEEPELTPDMTQAVVEKATQEAMNIEMQVSGGQPVLQQQQITDIVQRMKSEQLVLMREEAMRPLKLMKSRMVDQLEEGGYFEAMNAFIDDLVTFPFAMIKGPVPRRRKQLKWAKKAQEAAPGPMGGNPADPTSTGVAGEASPDPAQAPEYEVDVQEVIRLEWERVDPFMIYWAPHATEIEDGYLIERHKMTREDLLALKGVAGYNDEAIDAVLDEHGRGGLKDWLAIDTQKAVVEGKSVSAVQGNPEPVFDALQYWGSVQGKMLIEWGMDEKDVPDQTKEYPCEVWLVGRWVIKAVLNYDPLARKPYYKTSYELIPGGWCGNGVADLCRDVQDMCNDAARALANNMGISSGPQAMVNVDRLPEGEEITQMFPWKIWQTTSDPYGNTQQPVTFFQPSSNVSELMAIYEKFSLLADEYTGVPRYMTGDAPAHGAGRTASGMSMLMGNASKSMKQVIGNVDMGVTDKLIKRLHYHNMKYSEDSALKGDVLIIVTGVNNLVAKEQAQVRMNEILNIVASNPMFVDIVGEESIADLLREVTSTLNMNIVPPKEVIKARIAMKQQMQMMQMLMAQQMAGQPESTVDFQRDENGAVQGAKVMPGNGQKLLNGQAIADHFQPQRVRGTAKGA